VLSYLRANYRRVPTDQSVCHIFALNPVDPNAPTTGEDGLPLPPPEMRGLVGGDLPVELFFDTGRYAATWIAEMLSRNGYEVSEMDALLDFGCGCGRVIRHWPGRTAARLHGCDYNPYLIAWCREHLPFGEFATNGLEPPLPYADDSIDFLYSLSIFTHLDEPLQVPWMREVTRVVRPGGALLVTFQGRSRVYEAARVMENGARYLAAFDAGELVVAHSRYSGSSGCSVWHPERYIREVLAREAEIVDYSPGGALDIQQDAVLFRKPA
jgi:SAM-dependent methyltransferase